MPLSDLSKPDVRFDLNWRNRLRRGAEGTPLLPVTFTAAAGARLWRVDVRTDADLTGELGHIPGAWRLPLERIGEVRSKLGPTTPVVLVCNDGRASATAARYLEGVGFSHVAAMQGGMQAWRAEGFTVSRATSVLTRELPSASPDSGSDGRSLNWHAGSSPTEEIVRQHVGDPAHVQRVKLASLLQPSTTSCVDGREDQAVVGTPGGDAGELLLGVAAVERVSGQQVDAGNMSQLKLAFADTFGAIYLHTDNHALNHLAASLRGDPRVAPYVEGLFGAAAWETFLRNPPLETRSALLEHLVQPGHVGCGHLKLALSNPDQYYIRPELITSFFVSFYQGLWNGAQHLEWVVLGGDHAEGAVIQVTVEGELDPFTEIPLIHPQVGGGQVFVNHPQAVTWLRQQTARFLDRRVGNLLPSGQGMGDRLAVAIPELGGVQMGATLAALASGLPLFDVQFQTNGEVTVSSAGQV